MTARSTPMMMPATMAMTVSSRVTTMPRRIGVAKRYCPTTPHWKRPSRTPPRDDVGEEQGVDQHGHQHQDHGAGHPAPRVADGDDLQGRRVPARPPVGERRRRPGSVRHRVGRGRSGTPQLVAPLIIGRGDRPGLHAPLGQDLVVDAVGDQQVHGGLHRGGHAVALGEGQAVGGDLEGGAAVLEHPVGGGHDVGGHLASRRSRRRPGRWRRPGWPRSGCRRRGR